MADDEARVRALRAQLPATEACVYLNTGTSGPLPERAHRAVLQEADDAFRAGRIGPDWYPHLAEVTESVRKSCARLLGCSPEEIMVTHATTEGLNVVLSGIDWRVGDEIVTARTEHPGALYPIRVIHGRFGVRPVATDIGLPGVDPLEELRRHLSSRTRMVVLSHVTWSTGAILPMREIAAIAHEAGALVVVDGAQSVGMVPTDARGLGVDAIAFSGQKWLCGPVGTGGLFIRAESLERFRLTYAGYFSLKPGETGEEGPSLGDPVPADGARRHEAVSMNLPSLAGFSESLAWFLDDVGADWAYGRIARMGKAFRDGLASLPGVRVITPEDAMAGIVHFRIEGTEPPDVTAALQDRRILIRHTPWPAANRLSAGFYNSDEDLARFLDAVGEIAAHPERVRGRAQAGGGA